MILNKLTNILNASGERESIYESNDVEQHLIRGCVSLLNNFRPRIPFLNFVVHSFVQSLANSLRHFWNISSFII